jgi:NAD(P)-dependent dehydrogenase (short-subunit alcohol dehydrogenase family)
MGLAKETVDEWTKQIAIEVPMKRFGQPDEGAATVAFLASRRIIHHRSRSTWTADSGRSEQRHPR